jgi:hypothetical protein
MLACAAPLRPLSKAVSRRAGGLNFGGERPTLQPKG